MGKVSKALSKAAENEHVTRNDSYPELKKTAEHPKKENQEPISQPVKTVQSSGKWDERLILSAASTGAVAESIRTLRTKILYPVMGDAPRTILVTSASPGEGKSFVCANLAIALAQGVDSYCILLDCDLRRPSQHRLFGFENERGVVNHLQNGTSLEDLIVHPGIDRLSVLPSGPPPVNPAELSGSADMIRLLDQLRSRYEDRFVIMDSPPLQAAAETAVLAQHVDGVVLVVRQGVARRDHVKKLAEAIGREKIVGVVFNAYKTNVFDKKVFGYGDYKSDYYHRENQ